MNVLMLGKLPPIQGGVSTSNYWTAADLAKSGHAVDFVTNSEQAEQNIRCFSFPGDSVSDQMPNLNVHQVEAVSYSAYTPWSPPYLSLLLGRGRELIEAKKVDALVGWYFQPYGLAAGILSKFYDIPLILRHAGSDMGRLANYSDMRSAFSMIVPQATKIVASRSVMQQFKDMGAASDAIIQASPRRVSDAFSKADQFQDISQYVRAFPDWLGQQHPDLTHNFDHQREYRGDLNGIRLFIYGKVGERKGSFALLEALDLISDMNFELVACIGGLRRDQRRYLEELSKKPRLAKKVQLVPPLMPWHIPVLVNAAHATLFLENRFPITFHSPLVPREILASKSHFVCSKEIVEKSPYRQNLVDGKNLSIVEDPDDVERFSELLKSLIGNPAAMKDMARQAQFLSEFIEDEYSPRAQLCSVLEGL